MTLVVPIASGSEIAEENEHSQHEEGAHGSHATHRHHFSIAGAATYSFEEDEAHPTVGLDYVYRLRVWEGRVGIGAFGEAIFAEHTEGIIGLPVYVYPYKGLSLFAGPGVEIVTEESEADGEEHGSGSDTEAKFLFRFGIGYSVELGKGFSIMPNIDIDLVRENPALVFGVGLGKSF